MTFAWTVPDDWQRITAVDAHTEGEPLRVIVDGLPPLPGDTILAKRRYAQTHLDGLRRALMWEPRGHADMYGAILTPPVTPDGDVGVLFLHNGGFSTMCGHGIIGLVTVGLETGLLTDRTVRIDTPAGRVTAVAEWDGSRVTAVSFHNVPSFVYRLDETVDVPGLGAVRYDVAFGGAFYAFVQADEVGVGLTASHFRQLIDVGQRIKQAVMASLPIVHPVADDLGFLYGTIFVGAAHEAGHHSRNVCVFADGEVDRCPTGTGVSARAALHFAKGEIGVGEPFVVESILGTTFTAMVAETTTFGGYTAVVPQVTGSAYITGINQMVINPHDPLRQGFLLR